MTPVCTPVPVATGPLPVLDRLREMAAASGAERCRLREAFIGDQRKLFRLLAHRLCRTLGLAAALHRDDVERLVATEALAWVDELLADPAAIEGIENFEGMLHVRSRASVRAWTDRHLSPASGMVSLNRRVRQLNQLRDEMRAITGAGFAAGLPEESLLHPTEGPALVRAVIERTSTIGGVTADVAEAWLSGVHSSEGAHRVLTPREVAAQLGLSQESAAAQIRKVRTLAQRIIAENLGTLRA